MPLRVTHVIGGLELGGAETLLYRLATHPMRDVQHQVICLGPRDWYSSRLIEQGVSVDHLGIVSPLSALSGLARLKRRIRESRPDVIQAWMYFANVLSSLSASGTPVVWGIHGSTLEHLGRPSHALARIGGRLSPRLADFVINCSERSAELHRQLGYDAVRNAVIANGYDPAAFRPDDATRADVRKELGIGERDFVVGCIARWHSQKDIPNLLGALRAVADRTPVLRCLLVGRGLGSENSELRAEVRRNNCEDLVVPLGSRSDVGELARAIDLHVLASSGGEAFPNVVGETMLSGTPNVVTDVGDSARMVGDTGWVVRPGDPQRMADAVAEAYAEWRDRPDSWQSRRVRARQRIAERFTFERMVEAYQQVWTRVADTR